MNNELCIQLLQKDSSVLGQGKETLLLFLKYQRFLFDWRKSWIPKLIKFQMNQIKNHTDELKFPLTTSPSEAPFHKLSL